MYRYTTSRLQRKYYSIVIRCNNTNSDGNSILHNQTTKEYEECRYFDFDYPQVGILIKRQMLRNVAHEHEV